MTGLGNLTRLGNVQPTLSGRSSVTTTAGQPGRRWALVRRTFGIVALVLVVVLSGACDLVGLGGDDATPTPIRPRPTPPPVSSPESSPTPEPIATETPLPTATPVPNLGRREVERLVWSNVSSCAEQLARAGQGTGPEAGGVDTGVTVIIEVVISSRYSPAANTWLVEVSNNEPALTFGIWEVVDTTGQVIPLDDVALSIATPGATCGLPSAYLATSLTPPRLLMATPTPLPEPTATPAPVVDSLERAALTVWTGVYNCYGHFPDFSSFQAFAAGPRTWTVEGKSGVTHYGLWQVDAFTEAITPLDELAVQAQERCALRDRLPTVVSGDQARLRVWIALYDCYPETVIGESDIPIPPEDFFQAFQESAERWVVEGKGETERVKEITQTEQGTTETSTVGATPVTFYGLWKVDTDTGDITALNARARNIIERNCFRPL